MDSRPILPTVKDVIENNAEEKLHPMDIFSLKGGESQIEGTYKLKGRFQMGGQYHYHMETLTCVCIPIEDGMEVYATTQWIDCVQAAIAQSLGIPDNSLNMNVRRLGGAYGAKISRVNQVACAAALATHLLNKPVRFVMSLEDNMSVIGKRYGCISDYEVEVGENGRIVNMKNDYIEDYGSSSNEPAYLTTPYFSNCYDSKGWKVTQKMAITDAPR